MRARNVVLKAYSSGANEKTKEEEEEYEKLTSITSKLCWFLNKKGQKKELQNNTREVEQKGKNGV